MKAPSFWYGPQPNTSARAALLSPLSAGYAALARYHRDSSQPQKTDLAVICLGNLVAGGTGKTPTAIALLQLLKEHNVFLTPGFLTRGYGGKINQAERVDESHDPVLWGDEALILHRHGPTFVSRNRYQGAQLMEQHGCDAIIMDDGLQHYTLRKDVSFAIINGMMGFGNGMVIPAGPLRQPLEEGFAMSDAFILIDEDERSARSKLPKDKPVFTARMDVPPSHIVSKATPYIGFCGIGYPEKFKSTLLKTGAQLAGWHTFADHHPYTMAEMEKLVTEAINKEARLITTEKDYARLPDFAQKTLIDMLPIEIIFDDPQGIVAFIKDKTAAKRSS